MDNTKFVTRCNKHGKLTIDQCYRAISRGKLAYRCAACARKHGGARYARRKAGIPPIPKEKGAKEVMRKFDKEGLRDNAEFRDFYKDYLKLRKLIKGKALWMKKRK
jgi:hypothetical protein